MPRSSTSPFPRSLARRRAMLGIAALAAGLLVAAGCAPTGYWTAPPGMTAAVLYENPTLLPVADHSVVWTQVVDVVDDYFRIDREEPVRLIGNTLTEGRIDTFPKPGATFLEPWDGDSASPYERLESTVQSIRRFAQVRVMPGEGGYWVAVHVYKELEDVAQPENATAGAATFRHDDSLTRVVDPIAGQEVHEGWIPQGRDPALEQRMIADLHARFGRPAIRPAQPIPHAAYRHTACRHTTHYPPDPADGSLRVGGPLPVAGPLCVGNLGREALGCGRLGCRRFGGDPCGHDEFGGDPFAPGSIAGREALVWEPVDRRAWEPTDGTTCGTTWCDMPGGAVLGHRWAGCEWLQRWRRGECPTPILRDFVLDLGSDYREFYSLGGVMLLAGGVGVAAILANTPLDQKFQDWHDRDVKSHFTDDLTRETRWLGNGTLMIPVFAGAALVGPRCTFTPLGEIIGRWGSRSMRAVAVGGPLVLALQWGLGASRPGETSAGSKWKPFDDNNAVSGHAFIGAIPFITAAMMTPQPIFKAALYAASAVPAWGRIDNQRHYLSQALLGWWLAYLAAAAAERTESLAHVTIIPLADGEMVGLGAVCQW